MSAWKRFWAALSALWTGKLDEQTEALHDSVTVVKGSYQQAIDAKLAQAEGFAKLVAEEKYSIAEQERRRDELIDEIGELEQDVASAFAACMQRDEVLRKGGADQAAIDVDPEYVKYLGFSADAESSLKIARANKEDLDASIDQAKKSYQSNLQSLHDLKREIDKIETESIRNQASMKADQNRERIAKLKSGLVTDAGDQNLDAARKAVGMAKARAETHEALAGTSASAQRAEVRAAGKAVTARSDMAARIAAARAAESGGAATPAAAVAEGPGKVPQ